MKRILKSVIIISIIISLTSLNVNAHEMLAGRRWVNKTTISGKNYLNVSVNSTYLVDTWKAVANQSALNWNNYSNTYVCEYLYNSTSATAQLASCTTWFSFFPSNGIAATNIMDSNGNWFWNFNTGVGYNIGNNIVLGHVYTNPAYNSNTALSAFDKQKTLTHELGHVLNLSHTTTDVSVMRQGQNLPWSNYDRPQDHDRADLVTYYKTSLGR